MRMQTFEIMYSRSLANDSIFFSPHLYRLDWDDKERLHTFLNKYDLINVIRANAQRPNNLEFDSPSPSPSPKKYSPASQFRHSTRLYASNSESLPLVKSAAIQLTVISERRKRLADIISLINKGGSPHSKT